jgi:hypothetical protein
MPNDTPHAAAAQFQTRNECLICRNIAIAPSVCLPLQKYWSSCDAPSNSKTAITKPLSIVGIPWKETANRAGPGLNPFGIRYRCRDLSAMALD